MKKLFAALTVILLFGCTNTPDFPTINDPSIELTTIKKQYAEELANIHVGDYIDYVAKQFPEMFVTTDNMKNTIYEFTYPQQYLLANNSEIKTYTQTLRFYFINQNLAHWKVK